MRFFKNSFSKATLSVKNLAAASVVLIVFSLGFVAAYGQAGTLDTTFNTTGKQTTTFAGGASSATSVAIQSNGKIVAAGSVNGAFALARYNTDGTLDTTGFGTGGAGGGTVVTSIQNNAGILALRVRSDQIIVAAGLSFNGSGSPFLTLAHYTSTGALDTTFGGGTGIVTTPIPTTFVDIFNVAIEAEPNSRIAVVGDTVGSDPADFAVSVFSSAGVLDTTFGDAVNHVAVTDIGDGDSAFAATFQPDGKVVAGGVSNSGAANQIALVRYTSTGTPDPTFNGTGIVTTNVRGVNTLDDEIFALAVDASNNILAAGTSTNSTGKRDLAIARYSPVGVLDPSFGVGGVNTTTVSAGNDFANSIVLQSDGKIVAAGEAGTNSDFGVVRYNTNGTPDSTFGLGGASTIDFGGTDNEGLGNSVAVQTDGKIVVAGQANAGVGTGNFAVARLLGTSIATAAGVTVSGHVTNQAGAGIQNVVVTLTDAQTGDTKQVKTKKKGFFFFKNVRISSYTISVSAKKYSFDQPSQFIIVKDDTTVDFTATR